MSIRVIETAAQASSRAAREKGGKPSHWVHSKPTEFKNPWPSWRADWGGVAEAVGTFPKATVSMMGGPSSKSIAQIPIRKPYWLADGDADAKKLVAENAHKIKATWLGHACFLVELPSSTAGVRGARILFDPVFSDRCSPSQWVGPKRFTPPPCALEDVPEIDAIVISHNHYDHMDTASLKHLLKRPNAPHVFAPLGNNAYFHSLGVPAARTHCLDWWDARRVRVSLSEDKAASEVEVDITFTPGQHFTGRGILDRFKSLWGGWVVENASASAESASAKGRVYFGGDTGYRSVPSDTDDGPETLPVCPAFKEIGEHFGGFDMAMIPIGAYAPRRFMSPIHCAPRDSVAIFKDIRAKTALGMHWGAWVLTTEDILEPPVSLAAECAKQGVGEGAFGVCAIGETKVFDVQLS